MKRCMISTVVCLAALFGQSPAVTAAPFYEGKVVTIMVGSKPGGSYDRIARLVGKYLPKYVPGKPTVIIENRDGADSMICANYIFNNTRPDGLTIGAFNQAMPLNQLCNLPGIRLDVRKFIWLGSPSRTSAIMVARTSLPYKNINDLIKSKYTLLVGAQGMASNSAQIPAMLQAYAGLKIKLVMYPSTSDVTLAIRRSEVDAQAGSYDTFKPFIDEGLVRPLVRGYATQKATENLPFNEDLTTDKKGKMAMRMLSMSDLIGRPFVFPPKTPPALVNTMRDAFAKMTVDRELIAEAARSRAEIQFTSGKELEKVVEMLFNQPPDVMAEFFKHVPKY